MTQYNDFVKQYAAKHKGKKWGRGELMRAAAAAWRQAGHTPAPRRAPSGCAKKPQDNCLPPCRWNSGAKRQYCSTGTLSPAQRAALAAGRAKRRAHVGTLPGKQVYKSLGMAPIWDQDGGAKSGCRVNPETRRCHGYNGPDKGGCMKGPTGRCRQASTLKRAYAPKRKATPAQLAALAKARAARNRARSQVGGFWW